MNDAIEASEHAGSPPGAPRWPGVLLVTLGLFLVACGEPEEPASSAETAAPVATAPTAPLPGAVYHTELAFVGKEAQPSLLYLRFENRTDSAMLRLHYRGWFGGEAWNLILDRADSLPVPRAAWRVLPTGPVRVMAGDGGEPSSVVVGLPEGALRLDSRGAIASWNSRTGQRESLRLAELVADSGAEAGLLLARQRGRRVDAPADGGPGQYFMVTDTTGAGLIIMRDDTSPDAPVTTWTWFDETEAEWSDALVLALAAPEGAPGRWSFELPDAGLLGEIRGTSPALVDTTAGEPGFEVFRVEATLLFEGQSWIMRGIGVQGRNVE